MPSLLELQRRFAGALLDPATAPTGGLAVYRDSVLANRRNALGATFVVVRELTGAPFFDAAVDAFARAHPSRGGDLNVYGDAFADFLAAYPHARDLPYLPDVARLEWAMDEAQRAADEIGTPEALLAALAAVPPAEVATRRFRLDASCRLQCSRYPVLRIWQAHRGVGQRLEDIAFDGPDDRLLVRRERGQVTVERLPAGEHAWLAALAGGADFAAALDAALAADPAFDLARALQRRVADGTLAALG
jgi:hypothetical protein